MNAARSGHRAYWHSGGAIMSCGGPLPVRRAIALFQFFGREAALCRLDGEHRGARHCARQAVDLARAIVDSDDWQCAARGGVRSKSTHDALRALTLDLSRDA